VRRAVNQLLTLILNIVLLDAMRTSGDTKQILKTVDKINDDLGKVKDGVADIRVRALLLHRFSSGGD
jgi:hypothetical protein